MRENPYLTMPAEPFKPVRRKRTRTKCVECGFSSRIIRQGPFTFRAWHHKPGCPNDGRPTGEPCA